MRVKKGQEAFLLTWAATNEHSKHGGDTDRQRETDMSLFVR